MKKHDPKFEETHQQMIIAFLGAMEERVPPEERISFCESAIQAFSFRLAKLDGMDEAFLFLLIGALMFKFPAACMKVADELRQGDAEISAKEILDRVQALVKKENLH